MIKEKEPVHVSIIDKFTIGHDGKLLFFPQKVAKHLAPDTYEVEYNWKEAKSSLGIALILNLDSIMFDGGFYNESDILPGNKGNKMPGYYTHGYKVASVITQILGDDVILHLSNIGGDLLQIDGFGIVNISMGSTSYQEYLNDISDPYKSEIEGHIEELCQLSNSELAQYLLDIRMEFDEAYQSDFCLLNTVFRLRNMMAQYKFEKTIKENTNSIFVFSSGNDHNESFDDSEYLHMIRELAQDDSLKARTLVVGECFNLGHCLPGKLKHYVNCPGDNIDYQNMFVVAAVEDLPALKIMSPNDPGTEVKEYGTSYAAPVVTALIAKIHQLYPDLTQEEVVQLVKDGCTPKYPPSRYGCGIVNPEKSIELAGQLQDQHDSELTEDII